MGIFVASTFSCITADGLVDGKPFDVSPVSDVRPPRSTSSASGGDLPDTPPPRI